MSPSPRDVLRLLGRLPSDRASLELLVATAAREWSWASRGVVLGRLKRLVRRGEVVVAVHPAAGRLVHLTPLGARRLKVVLSPDSREWWFEDEVDDRMIHVSPEDVLEQPDVVLLLADRGPTTFERVLSLDGDSWMTRPEASVRFVGDQGCIWRRPVEGEPCPFHAGRLRGTRYCLYCDAFGRGLDLGPVKPVYSYRLA